jgi:hypothetical protein
MADGRRAYAVMTGTSALRRIEPPRVPEQPERLLLNTLWALGELAKEGPSMDCISNLLFFFW